MHFSSGFAPTVCHFLYAVMGECDSKSGKKYACCASNEPTLEGMLDVLSPDPNSCEDPKDPVTEPKPEPPRRPHDLPLKMCPT